MVAAVGIAIVPLMLAALGGLLTERAGSLNISLEGALTIGAFSAAAAMIAGFPPMAAALISILSGAFLGTLLSIFHLGLGSNLFIAGLGINLLAPSLAGLASQLFWGHKGILRIPDFHIARQQWLGISPAAWAMPLLALLVSVILFRTAFGRRIRAVGESPAFLNERGFRPASTQAATLVLSSSSAGLAGAFLVFRVGAYVPGMSAGRGWIALVVIWLGFRNPWGILGASILFALAEIFAAKAQGMFEIPASLLLSLPYLVALTALSVATIGKNHRWADWFKKNV